MIKLRFIRRHLLIKGEYAKAILEGKKKATIRLGLVKPRRREVIIHCGGRALAKARITSYEFKKLIDLTDEDAKIEGFKSVEELKAALKRHYKDISDDSFITVIRFEVIQKLDKLDEKKAYMGLKPDDIAALALRYCVKVTDDERKILEELTRTKSIRKTAFNLFNDLNKRWIIRRVLKKVLRDLVRRGIIDYLGKRSNEEQVNH